MMLRTAWYIVYSVWRYWFFGTIWLSVDERLWISVCLWGIFSCFTIYRWLRLSENSAICSLIFYRSASELILFVWLGFENEITQFIICSGDFCHGWFRDLFFFHSWYQLNWAFSLITKAICQWVKSVNEM